MMKNCALEKKHIQNPGRHHTMVIDAQRNVLRPIPVVIEKVESSATKPASGVPILRNLTIALR